jgi:hypothetical protein
VNYHAQPPEILKHLPECVWDEGDTGATRNVRTEQADRLKMKGQGAAGTPADHTGLTH